MSDAIIPVGRDCDCGHPMIWRDGAQVCAVYGRHAATDDPVVFVDIERRDYRASGAALVKACMDAPNLTRGALRHRAIRERARAAKAVA